ncbi:Ig-like domain-containing protein, partial [uncultured Hoeflea sp.]|uniref:tandem-95 repeat protein n=1 Tax=uncultured Hoeflea sp. TaxID=538666 RepID=UPI0030EF2E62
MTEGLGNRNESTQPAESRAEPREDAVLLAQADTGGDPVPAAASGAAASPNGDAAAAITPGEDNTVRLAGTLSLENIVVDGEDLLLIQPDGTQVRINGAAVDVPTFILGEIEVPRETLISALRSNGFDVAAGPGDTLSVSPQAPEGSGGTFEDASGASIVSTGLARLNLLEDAPEADDPSNASPDVLDDGSFIETETGQEPDAAPVNDAPVLAGDLAAVVDEAAAYVLTAADIGYIDTDDDDTGVSFIVSGMRNGVITVNGLAATTFTPEELAAGVVVFTHDGSETLSAGFDIAVEDGNEDSSAPVPQSFDFSVNPVDDAPVALDDVFSVDEDSGATSLDVLGNDTDVDGGPKLIQSVTQPANGTVVITGGGAALSFEPDADFNTDGAASQSFTYTLNDGSTATVTLTVNPVNDAPAASADAYALSEDGTLVVNAANGVLANDTDVEGDTLGAVLASDVSNGSLIFNADGSFSYTPDADFHGEDSFSYTVNDGTEDGNTVTVTLTVNPVNDAPVASANAYALSEDGTLVVNAANGVLANDTDVEGDTLGAVLASDVSNGSLIFNADGSFSYTPDADFHGEDSFSYTVNDGTEDGNTVTVTLTIDPVNDVPVAAADAYAVDEDGTLVVNAANGVLANDTDVEGDTLGAVLASDVSNGSLIFNADGSFSYTPDADFHGEDSFSYTVN